MELKPVHPGEILAIDFMNPLGMKSKDLSELTGIPEMQLKNLIDGNGRMTFDIAHRLSIHFHTSTDFWINIQKTYDEQA